MACDRVAKACAASGLTAGPVTGPFTTGCSSVARSAMDASRFLLNPPPALPRPAFQPESNPIPGVYVAGVALRVEADATPGCASVVGDHSVFAAGSPCLC